MMDILVSTDWLAEALGVRDLRIADASWFLPGDGRDAGADYRAAHIPGAVFLDLAEIVAADTDLPMMLPPPEKFVSRMQALGLGDGTRIVLYDGSPHHTAARAWVMLASFGIPAAILDGGLAKWRNEARPLATGDETPRPRHLTARVRGEGIVGLAQVRETRAQIVDARSPARFAGAEPEPRAGVVPGHIPGAINLHYARFFEEDGSWKRGEALAAVFASAGVDPKQPIVATCGSGVTASIVAVAARLLGGSASVYDGSWAEWGSRPDTPKATGA